MSAFARESAAQNWVVQNGVFHMDMVPAIHISVDIERPNDALRLVRAAMKAL